MKWTLDSYAEITDRGLAALQPEAAIFEPTEAGRAAITALKLARARGGADLDSQAMETERKSADDDARRLRP